MGSHRVGHDWRDLAAAAAGCGWGFPGGARHEEPDCQCRRHKRHGFDSWVGKIPWRRAWQPIPIFLPGESHGHFQDLEIMLTLRTFFCEISDQIYTLGIWESEECGFGSNQCSTHPRWMHCPTPCQLHIPCQSLLGASCIHSCALQRQVVLRCQGHNVAQGRLDLGLDGSYTVLCKNGPTQQYRLSCSLSLK